MANFFSLNDGTITDPTIYGYSLANAEVTNNTTVTTIPNYLYSTNYISDTTPLTALAINLSSRVATPTGTLGLTIQRTADLSQFIDDSSNKYIITSNGTPGTPYNVLFTPFSPNGWSAYFDVAANYISINSNAALDVGMGGSFTIEAWIYVKSSGATQSNIFQLGSHIGGIHFLEFGVANSTVFGQVYNGGSGYYGGASLASTLQLNTWTHVAYCWNGTTAYISVGGNVSTGVALVSGNMISGYTAYIGAYYTTTNANAFNGYISNLRVVKGSALYTSTYTPPNSPLTNITGTSLLLFNGKNGFNDKSNNNFSLTINGSTAIRDFGPFVTPVTINDTTYGASGYFNGLTYLTIPYNSNLALSTNNFTIEAWIYIIPNGQANNIIYTSNGFNFAVNSDRLTFYNGSSWVNGSTTRIVINSWYHVAVVREGTGTNQCKLYIDGNLELAFTNSYNHNGTNPTYITHPVDYRLNGYISNLRLVNGTALYTSNFTPSSSRLTNINNTALLLNTNNIGVRASATETYAISSFTSYDSSNSFLQSTPQGWQILKLTNPFLSNNLDVINYSLNTSSANQLSLLGTSTVVDATNTNTFAGGTSTPTIVSNSPSFIPENSLSFNGTSDSYIFSSNYTLTFGTNDFTIECWIYMTSVAGSSRVIFSTKPGVGTGAGNVFCVYLTGNNNTIQIYCGSTLFGNGTSVTLNTWHHVALTRYKGIAKLYLDGNLSTAGGSLANNFDTSIFSIGSNTLGTTEFYSGLISNFRIINGVALYTGSSLTPPSSPLKYVYGTVCLLKCVNNHNKALLKNNVLVPTSTDNIHIGGALKGLTIEPRTITATTSTFNNLYIHNKGTLNFPLTSSNTLTINGSNGLQITGDGTLNVGTSSSVIPLSTTHTIILNNTQLDVNNGGTLNTYGYPRLFTTNLVNDAAVGSNTFTTTDQISSIWNVGDSIAFKPNLTNKTNFDVLTLSSFNSGNIFTTTANSSYLHLSSYPTVAGVYNLSKNVIIRGSSTSNRGTVRTLSAAKTNINYTQFSNFGINTTNKTGLILGNTINGSNILSGNSFIGDTTYTNDTILFYNCYNNTIINNILYKPINGLNINIINNISNSNINDNFILNSSGNGLQVLSSSGTISLSNNNTVGSVGYGTILANSNLSGTFGAGIGYNSGNGMLLSSSTFKSSIFQGGSINSGKDGIYIDTSTINLSSLQFQNIIANNNSGVGFRLSGTSTTYTNPIYLNINGLTASNNSKEGVNIDASTLYLSGISLQNVIANNNISIGIKLSGTNNYINNINLNINALTASNNTNEGVSINSGVLKLSSISINNIVTNNNSSVGFKVSGNSLNYLNPITLNVNGLTASTNNTYGIEAYNIKGNLSSLTINNNLSGGVRTSIGNGSVTFDGLSSTTSETCLNILSAYNYYDTTIKNSYLSSNNICLILDSTRFGKFSIENSILSSTTPIQLNTTRNLLEGSYLFNNNYMGNISFVDLTKYQGNVYKNTGFAFMNHNKLSGNHFSYIPGGTKARDTVVYDPTTTDNVSERLTPITFNTKLRSSSKFVAINSGDLTNIRVNVLVVSGYNGNPPRLILKRNPSAGVYSDMVLNSYNMSLGYDQFFELVGASPYVIDNSILEFYVDCDGTSGYVCIDTWYAN